MTPPTVVLLRLGLGLSLLGATACLERARPVAPDAGLRGDAGPRPLAVLPPGDGLHPVRHVGVDEVGEPVVALRLWRKAGVAQWWVVEPRTLRTRLVPFEGARLEPVSEAELGRRFADSPWLRTRFAIEHHAASLQDAGLTHLLPVEQGVVLTVNLCPSHKHFDRAFLEAVLAAFTAEEKPVPVAFALTGLWMREHPAELAWLSSLAARGELAPTWIDHSFHHHFDPALPMTQNFLLEPGTDLEQEVLLTEQAMLEAGLVPSIFFRFPGLVSNAAAVDRVVGFGLVPVGSDAWLAKKERAQAGSIVLVHGNGNEPQGLAAFLALVKAERRAIHRRQFFLLDLRDAADESGRGP